jgi:hypothetical protein
VGIIDSLSAGYRFLGRRVELLLVPILLDLLLYFGPRLSVAPIYRQIAGFYREAAGMQGVPADMVTLSRQVSDMLTTLGESSNLLDGLVNSSLLHVPSLLAAVGGPASAWTLTIGQPLAAAALFGSIGLLGLLVGVVYMNLLAAHLPIGGGPKPMAVREFVAAAARHWLMLVIYVLLIAAGVVAVSVPTVLVTALFALVSPGLSTIFGVLLVAAFSVLFFYLYFVTAAIVLDNLPVHLAIARSFVLVRNNFWATLGFVLIYNVIALGFMLITRRLLAATPAGAVAAIVLNAYIGSGLAMALLVFYRTRLLKHAELSHLPNR